MWPKKPQLTILKVREFKIVVLFTCSIYPAYFLRELLIPWRVTKNYLCWYSFGSMINQEHGISGSSSPCYEEVPQLICSFCKMVVMSFVNILFMTSPL